MFSGESGRWGLIEVAFRPHSLETVRVFRAVKCFEIIIRLAKNVSATAISA